MKIRAISSRISTQPTKSVVHNFEKDLSSASKILNRTGTNPRTIHYSQPKRDVRFDYQDPSMLQIYNPTIELKGTLNIRPNSNLRFTNIIGDTSLTNKTFTEPYSIVKIKPEVNNFRRINLKNLPDTKRTLVPERNKEDKDEIFLRSKSFINLKKPNIITSDNLKSVLANENTDTSCNNKDKNIYRGKKIITCNKKSNVFDNKAENNLNECLQHKKQKLYNNYSKYNTTTQIANLPGGIKRNNTEIKDDEDFKKFSKKPAFDKSCQAKLKMDFDSKISCLRSATPISVTNDSNNYSNKIRKYHQQQTYNISDNNYYTNLNTMSNNNIKKNISSINKNVENKNMSTKSLSSNNNFNLFKKSNYCNINHVSNQYCNSQFRIIDAHKPTLEEKKLIPNSKYKVNTNLSKNPFVSQIEIC